MDKLRIRGGKPLHGEIPVSGAKNAALPLMILGLLTDKPLTLRNIPRLSDVSLLTRILQNHGAEVEIRSADRAIPLAGDEACVRCERITDVRAPYELISRMRAGFWVLGPLLARTGRAEVSLPGGCAIGTRPVDLYLMALERLGAQFEVTDGYVIGRTTGRLNGNRIVFPKVSVGATQVALMASALAKGETIIENAAREPEITDVATCLIRMGAEISGVGSSTLHIQGKDGLLGGEHSVLPDRIEAGTYALAAAITGGHVTLTGLRGQHLTAFIDVLHQAGITVYEGKNTIKIKILNGISPVVVETRPYPGFPTDLQAQLMALAVLAQGSSTIRETIFENRFMHVQELIRLGADITLLGDTAHIRGVARLTGAQVMATDLRASACLVLAGLAAKGETIINRVYHLDRGFDRMEEKLRRCGAHIDRVS